MKTLGLIDESQLGRVLALIRSSDISDDFYAGIQRKPRLKRLLNSSRIQFQWAPLYELQIAELFALLIFTLDDDGSLQKGLKEAQDKQEFAISLGEKVIAEPDGPAVRIRARKILTAIALLQVLVKSMEAVQYFSLTMDELVRKAAAGNDEAMVRAVSIDPTVLSCPPIAHRFSVAVMTKEKNLLRRISKAFNGPHKGKIPNRDLRYIQRVLDEAGAFEVASRSQIFDVLANKLGLYEQLKGDPKKGLETLLARWREDATT